MNIIFFSHPTFLSHQSMPRFVHMLANGMSERGHKVDIIYPEAVFFKIQLPGPLKKWLGYIDQYIIFPTKIRRLFKNRPKNTLFVFADQALGPWVPLVTHYPHIIHCHDFLALRSALGEISENKTGWTGRQYQSFIRWGFTKGKNFISVSNKTKEELHLHLTASPQTSEVVYNGLNQSFIPVSSIIARSTLSDLTSLNLTSGYLLHIGGNQWYKNRAGVIKIYDAWRTSSKLSLPLLLIGESPTNELTEICKLSAFQADIHWLSGIKDDILRLSYCGASVFLFPSLAEGFGWPIAEAMASGCPVITTAENPMTEVAGNAAFLIPRCPFDELESINWAKEAAQVVQKVINLSSEERDSVIKVGLANATRFNSDDAINRIEAIYENVLTSYERTSCSS